MKIRTMFRYLHSFLPLKIFYFEATRKVSLLKICYNGISTLQSTRTKHAEAESSMQNEKTLFLKSNQKEVMLPLPNIKTNSAINWDYEMEKIKLEEDRYSVLEPCKEDISDIAPFSLPTFNFAAYINKSPSLQELVKLGVDLHTLEKRKGIPQFILKLDFNKDMKQHIRFLHDVGVPSGELGAFLTKNPLIFKENLEDLQIRMNYLSSKNFTQQMTSRIVLKNPYWLMFSTRRIDTRLGHFQKTFQLTGNQVRQLTVKQPRLITYNMDHIKFMTFAVKEEMGFDSKEITSLLLQKPKLWMTNQVILLQKFNYIHNIMKISHEQIVSQPEVLGSRLFRTQQRHMFLECLGRAQYNPKLEGYVPLNKLVAGTDAEFSQNVAKTSIQAFNEFLKSL